MLPLKHLGGFINRFAGPEQCGRALTESRLITATGGCLKHSEALALHQALQALPPQIAKHCRMGPCTAVIQASPNSCLPEGAVLVLDGELKNLTFRLPIRCIKKSKVPQPFAGF